MPSKNKKPDTAARVTFPLPATHQTQALVSTCEAQATTVLANPDIVNHADVAASANAVKAQAGVVDGTVTSLSTAEATVTTLRAKRSTGAILLRLLHANMESLVNVAAAGNKAAGLAYGGKVVTRTILAASDDAPTNPAVKNLVLQGEIEARCKAEKGVICYLFQMGGDPAHPEAWPPPIISGGSKHTFSGLTVGQKAYLRIAIVRTGGVQGKWSDVLTISVQ